MRTFLRAAAISLLAVALLESSATPAAAQVPPQGNSTDVIVGQTWQAAWFSYWYPDPCIGPETPDFQMTFRAEWNMNVQESGIVVDRLKLTAWNSFNDDVLIEPTIVGSGKVYRVTEPADGGQLVPSGQYVPGEGWLPSSRSFTYDIAEGQRYFPFFSGAQNIYLSILVLLPCGASSWAQITMALKKSTSNCACDGGTGGGTGGGSGGSGGIGSSGPATPYAARGIGVLRNDYNRDGNSDIVAVRDGVLHRWYGNGNGGFTYGGTYGSGWSAYAATLTAAGDINRDGNGDLIAVSGDMLHRWYGNGAGGFAYGGTYGAGWGPYASSLAAPGDISGDGVADLVAVNGGYLHRWYGTGSGGFAYAGTYGSGWTAYASTLTGVGDLNRDGIGDLVAVTGDMLHRWYGTGSGGFAYAGTYGSGWTPYATTLTGMGDINRDGNADLLAVRDDTLYRWYGNGAGGVSFTGTLGTGWGVYTPIH